MAAHYSGDMGMMRGNKRFLVGVGVSVVLHVMLMLAYRGGPALPAPEPDPSPPIAIRIVPPAPAPAPPRAEPSPQPPRAGATAPRSARKSTPTPVITVPASPRQEGDRDARTAQGTDEPVPAPDEPPAFDLHAARQTARQLAGQTKLGREGTALAQFPDPPLETESKFAKAISKAKRRNCKDGVPGGLLAPLFLAMDKKDSGCKW